VSAPAVPRNDVGDPPLIERAQAIAQQVSARGEEFASAGTLAGDVVEELRTARLFAMAMPRELGGLQTSMTTIAEVIAELAYGDASTAWTALIGNTAAFLSWLDPAVARTIVADDRDLVLAGSMAPTGRATVTDRAYLLNGRWPFASGSRHADWMIGGFVVHDGDRPVITAAGTPEMRIGFFPAASATIDPTWDVIGLAGTGSNDIIAGDLTVAAEYTAVPYAATPAVVSPLTMLSPYNILMVLFAGVPLGVARRALDELFSLAGTKRRPGQDGSFRDDPVVSDFAMSAEPALRAARLLVLDTFAGTEQRLQKGDDLAPRDRAAVAAVVMHAMRVGRDITAQAYRLGGTTATSRTHPLRRCHHDLAAAAQHIAFGTDLRRRVGQSLLGAPPTPALFGV